MNDTELDNYLEAGRIAKEVLHSCAAEIKPGVLMGDIFDMVVDQIESKGAMLSFPPHISFNDVAAHDSPSPCLLYTSPTPRDKRQSRMPSSACTKTKAQQLSHMPQQI